MEEYSWGWILQFLGRLHTLTVHFPIGLLVVAGFLEGLTIGGKRKGLRMGINWMVYIGTAFAILSTLLGWLLRTFDDYSGDLVQTHQNMGFVTSILATITAGLLFLTLKGKISNFRLYRIGLLITVISLTITGHLGANLTHGEGFLTDLFPGNEAQYNYEKSSDLLEEFGRADSLSETQMDQLNLEVRAIFAHNCYQCHSENKQKGELVLENKRGVFRGGKSGKVVVAGRPELSEIYKRITLPANHDDVMPKKGKVLRKPEIAVIKLWIDKGAHWADKALKVFPEAELALVKPDLTQGNQEFENPIDQIINTYFEEIKIKWPSGVDDQLFIRRAYLDIVGLLPSPSNIQTFKNDQRSNKRALLINELLEDEHNYTQHWLSFWNDLLRNDYSGTGFITGGRKQITDWLYKSLVANKPYDQMVKELVNPTEESEGFIKGIQWRGVVNASQRIEMQAAQNIGQSLMGVNVKCASCHNSFVSNLSLEQAYGFAAIFADSTLELNRCDMPLGKMATVNFLYPELGSIDAKTAKERRAQLSEIIVKPENGRLYRTITNRMWKRLLGRGIIEPVDEMDNFPWNATLLDWLAADFIESGYDLKHLISMIMTSKAYQLPSVHFLELTELKSEKYIFKGPTIRRLSAEQFSDVVSQIIAPVYHATVYDPGDKGMSYNRIWHREKKYDRDVLPEPGKRYFRHIFTLPEKRVEFAEILISVDHAYILYLNGENISQGEDWHKVDKITISEKLTTGDNIIAIEGTNEGTIPNPAGILFVMKIKLHEGEEIMVQSGNDWKSTDSLTNHEWINLKFDDKDWIKARNYGSRHWDRLVNFNFDTVANNFARASLVRQHPFMKALGRPSRENVATTREEQATLLQALELTNGDYFYNVLAQGTDNWIKSNGRNNEKIIDELYQKSFGRSPTKIERNIMLDALGDTPESQKIQDLFWATLLSPEFQFIF